jgi:3',5'-cyclic-AMP phosphodiesterase
MPIVLQLSDPHLLTGPDARLRGVPTRKTLADVLSLALARHPVIDRIVLTGDLAHDEAIATYEALRELLGAHVERARPLPGNHDDREALRTAFPTLPGAPRAAPEGETARAEARIGFCERVDGWCLVGLDSRLPGEDGGRLGPAHLAWLRERLAAHAGVPTVIFVHHPPVPTGHPVLDGMGLEDADALAGVLAGAPWVRAICHGHIHRDFEGRLGAVPVLGAPSTAFQFPAHPDLGAYALLPPGARVLMLGDEGLHTEVLRLPTLEHPPVEKQPTPVPARR